MDYLIVLVVVSGNKVNYDVSKKENVETLLHYLEGCWLALGESQIKGCYKAVYDDQSIMYCYCKIIT